MMKRAAPFVVVSIFIFILIWKYGDPTTFNTNNDDERKLAKIQTILPIKAPEPKIRTHEEYFDAIKKVCGELCNFEKKVTPGKFLGTVSAKVDCDALFNIDLIDRPSGTKPPRWAETPQKYKELVSHSGQVGIKEFYWDNTKLGGGRDVATVFNKSTVEDFIGRWNRRQHGNPYVGASEKTYEAANVVNVTGKNVLVIGSQSPWLEAVLLSRNAKKVVTVEYGFFLSEYPSLEFIRPNQLRERYLDGTLEKFDAIFTYSSVEHSGLGRYGDTLNPWGDVITIAQAWCVSTPDARLAIGVPTNVNGPDRKNIFLPSLLSTNANGLDRIEYNAHRVYGPVLYPFLTTNWIMEWPENDAKRVSPTGSASYQPYFIFKKQ